MSDLFMVSSRMVSLFGGTTFVDRQKRLIAATLPLSLECEPSSATP
ncbi:MAG: hypothetical protein AB7O39_08250 [Flavobacteriaceae bacterium]